MSSYVYIHRLNIENMVSFCSIVFPFNRNIDVSNNSNTNQIEYTRIITF